MASASGCAPGRGSGRRGKGQCAFGDEQDLGLLIDLIGHSASHQGYQPLSGDYLRGLYRMLASAGHVVLFIGEVHGDALAAELHTACGGMLRLRLRGLDRSGEAARLSVPAAITWEAMRWAKAGRIALVRLRRPACSDAASTARWSRPE